MAWMTKQSATEQIETRDEPYLTDEMKQRYTDELLPCYEVSRGALLPILHDVQHHFGYIPYQALVEIAEYLDLAPSEVLDTASFYDDFYLEPVGKHVIGICQSIACEVCDHQPIIDHACKRLGIEPGETTDNGLITIRTMECIGSCDTAPCALVDETRHDNLTIEKVDQILDTLQNDSS